MHETEKATAVQALTKNATEAYDRILTRYPVMERAQDASRRLQAMHQPVPKPTNEAIALNRKEEESRRSMGMFGHLMGGFTRHPDVAQATKVGDPTLTDTQTVSASDVLTEETRAMRGGVAPAGNNKVSVETVKTGAPQPNQAAPRSDTGEPAPDNSAAPASSGGGSSPASNSGTGASSAPADSGSSAAQVDPNAPAGQPANNGIGELKPNVPDSGSDGAAPVPPPAQVNEIQSGSQPNANSSSSSASSSSSSSSTDGPKDSEANYSSSKKKKKHKILPF
jgi:hypothetical protein